MRLLWIHRILIGSAIGLGILLGAWAAWRYARTGETSALALAAGSVLGAVALAFYWRTIPRKL